MRVLLAEDDYLIGDAILSTLKDAAYAVDWVMNGNEVISAIGIQRYDLILLDLGLPGKTGFEVLSYLRAQSNPISLLIISARDQLEDRIRGLDNGADDYLLKPFEMKELLARIRAVLRRKGGNATSILTNGIVTLDLIAKSATLENTVTETIPLSHREFALLQALLVRPGAILSRSNLEDQIYAWGEEVESNAVEFIIYSLRRKLGASVIKNVRGVGWMVSKSV